VICHRRRLVFVHLRRTGGNSVEAALGGILLFDRWFRRTDVWDNRLHRGRSWRKWDRRGHRIHATAAEIRAFYPLEFDRCFRFAIVRNPWEQMASLYVRLHPHDRELTAFRDWLRQFSLERGTVPQASLFDDDGRCLVDFIGRFEQLDDDFAAACDRAGLPRIALPHTNAGGRLDMTDIYDEPSMRIVERLYAADIERFGYTFGEAAHRGVQPIHRAA
jgi:hypothetical protein